MISFERMEHINGLVKQYGVEETAKLNKLPIQTIRDYVWRYLKIQADKDKAKILLFDIETAPLEVYVWNLYPKYIHISQIKEDWFVLCWSAKWLFGSEIFHGRISREEVLAKDDFRIVNSLWELIDDSDIILAHNCVQFDKPKMNTRFLKHGLKPPSSYQVIDTLTVARREFKVSSNKLDYLCQFLGLNIKFDTGFDLWKRCLKGDVSALKQMDEYCGNDVQILEELYLKLRPYIHSHPNLGTYIESDKRLCSNCGSKNIKWNGKFYHTPAGKYRTFRCGSCGAMNRVKFSEIKGDKKESLLRSNAR